MMHSGKLETYKMFGQKTSRKEVIEETQTRMGRGHKE
jgi:hypothetical protein